MVDAQAAAYLSLRLNLFLIVLLKSLVRSRLLLDGRQSIALLLVLWSSQIHHTFTLEFQRFCLLYLSVECILGSKIPSWRRALLSDFFGIFRRSIQLTY